MTSVAGSEGGARQVADPDAEESQIVEEVIKGRKM